MFRFKKSVGISYDRQGYIYFKSRLYAELSHNEQAKIWSCCCRAGGEYAAAVFEFVTTDIGAEALCQRHYISRSTLERAVRRYYELFD